MSLNYYTHNGQKYITSFPSTLFPLKTSTGPQECKNCEFYGTIQDGVFVGFCENCIHSYDNQFESRTDVSVVGAIESQCLPGLVLPNYITDAEYIVIQRIFIDEIKKISKNPPDNNDANFVYCECGEKVYIKELNQENWDAAYYYNTALCSTCLEENLSINEYMAYGPETELKQILSCIQ